MKKVLLIVLTMYLVFSFCGCGNNDAKTNNPTSSVADDDKNLVTQTDENLVTQTDENPVNNDDISDDLDVDLLYTFEDPSKPVVFDYPNMKCVEEGTSRIFKNSKYVIVYCRDSGNCNLEDIPNSLSEKFYNSTDIHLTAPFDSFDIKDTNSLKIKDQELLQIGGCVVVKRGDGTLVNLPMKGYTFVKDDAIFELIAVLSEESNDENQVEMEATIDAMINTLREER